MYAVFKYLFVLISVSSTVVQLDAVTINPSLCPTNKIAPHRRHVRENGNPRTLALLYELLAPRPPVHEFEPLNDLEEKPQEDDPDDCGEIEDYDETDLSSVTPGTKKPYKPYRENRYLFGENNGWSPYYPVSSKPPRPPSKPYRPYRPTRPLYYQQGSYGSNGYRPPSHYYYSSDHIKPVKEDTLDNPQTAFRPGVIGGILGHIVGFATVRPTTAATTQRNQNTFRFPESDRYKNQRQNKFDTSLLHTNRSSSIIGSFVHSLFK